MSVCIVVLVKHEDLSKNASSKIIQAKEFADVSLPHREVSPTNIITQYEQRAPSTTNEVGKPLIKIAKPGVIYAIDPLEKAKRKIEPISQTSLEAEIEAIFTVEVGDRPPIGLPALTERDIRRLPEILISKCEIRPEDAEDIKERKQIVDFAKQEFRKFIKNGGDPKEFLPFYQEELQLAYDKRMDAQRSIQKILKDLDCNDPEYIREYVTRIDKMLTDQGIKPTRHNKKIKELLGEPIEDLNN